MRDKTAQRAMLREVHLRNLIAKFKDLNERHTGDAAVPEAGLFWMSHDGKSFFKSSVSSRDAVDYGEFRIHAGSHYEEWPNAVRANPEWTELEYEECTLPRLCRSAASVSSSVRLRGEQSAPGNPLGAP